MFDADIPYFSNITEIRRVIWRKFFVRSFLQELYLCIILTFIDKYRLSDVSYDVTNLFIKNQIKRKARKNNVRKALRFHDKIFRNFVIIVICVLRCFSIFVLLGNHKFVKIILFFAPLIIRY